MEINILCFGVTRDIIGTFELKTLVEQGIIVTDLLSELSKKYPKLSELKSLKIAVNSEYVPNDFKIGEQDEIALIPPVSGG